MTAITRESTGRTTPARTRAVRGIVGVLALMLGAEGLTRAAIVDPLSLPPASLILLRVGELLVSREFMSHLGATIGAAALGLLVAAALAVPAGTLLGASRSTQAASRALIEFLRPIPSVALIPLAILIFGHGTSMKVAIIAYAAVWPILFNAVVGVHSVDPLTKDAARTFGLGRLAILVRVELPSALPFVVTGIRVAAAIALILAISTELLAGGRAGIGIWMLEVGAAGTRADLLYAGTVVAGLLGWAINAIMVHAERRLLAWQPALRST